MVALLVSLVYAYVAIVSSSILFFMTLSSLFFIALGRTLKEKE